MKHPQLWAAIVMVWSACGSNSEPGDSPAARSEPAAREPAPVEAELFPPAARRLLRSPALDLLPADTAGVVVVADPSGLADRLGLCDDDRGAALGRDLVTLVGFDLLHPGADDAPPVIEPDQPVAMAWLDPAASQRLLLFATSDPAAVRAAVDGSSRGKKRARRRAPSRVFERDGLVAVVLGPPSRELTDRLAAVTPDSRLTATPGFTAAAAALRFGDDAAAYLDPRAYPLWGAARGVAIGATLDDRHLRAAAAVALAPLATVAPVPSPSPAVRTEAWVAALGRRLGVDLGAAPAPADDPVLTRVLAARQPVAVVRGSALALYRGALRVAPQLVLARQAALRDAAEFGMIGLLNSGKASEKQRQERQELHRKISELAAERDRQAAELVDALGTDLGQLAMFARADGEVALLYGGVFPSVPPGSIVERAVELWWLRSSHSPEGSEIAALEQQNEELGRRIDRLESAAFAKMLGGPIGDGSMWGDSIGDSFGSGGFGLSGIGSGGGGTGGGAGTTGIGTIGHGGGGGYYSGYGHGGGGTGYGSGRSRRASGGAVSAGGGGGSSAGGTAAEQGKLDRAVIRQYIAARKRRFQDCRQPGVVGKVKVSFTIKADGWVARASATGLGDREVEACLEGIFSTFQFPAPSGGPVSSSYPVLFD